MNYTDYRISEEKIRIELNKELNEANNKRCIKKVLNFYNNNKAKCLKSYNNFKKVKDKRQNFIQAQETLSSEQFGELLTSGGENRVNILILTANEIENKILIWALKNEINKKLKAYLLDDEDNNPCVNINFCIQNKQNIIHYHVGKTGDEYTRRAINEVTHYFSPDYIILLGVCYGLDMDNQEMGLVNISEQVTGVRINFRDEPNSDKIIFEPEIEFERSPSENLTNRITRKLSNVEIIEKISPVPIQYMYGRIVSANSLMSCKTVKDSIIGMLQEKVRGTKKIIGGEMEACGIFKSNYLGKNGSEFYNWVVIKSICDWGESKNSIVPDKVESSKIKNRLQAYAMMNSCSVLLFLINNKAFL